MAIAAASKRGPPPVIHDVAWPQECHDWPGLRSIATVESGRETGGRIERKTRFYMMPLALPAAALGPPIRDRRAVENGLHWVMDHAMLARDVAGQLSHRRDGLTTLFGDGRDMVVGVAAGGEHL